MIPFHWGTLLTRLPVPWVPGRLPWTEEAVMKWKVGGLHGLVPPSDSFPHGHDTGRGVAEAGV